MLITHIIMTMMTSVLIIIPMTPWPFCRPLSRFLKISINLTFSSPIICRSSSRFFNKKITFLFSSLQQLELSNAMVAAFEFESLVMVLVMALSMSMVWWPCSVSHCRHSRCSQSWGQWFMVLSMVPLMCERQWWWLWWRWSPALTAWALNRGLGLGLQPRKVL